MNVLYFLQFLPRMVVRYLEVADYACIVQIGVILAKSSLDTVILTYSPGTLATVVTTNI